MTNLLAACLLSLLCGSVFCGVCTLMAYGVFCVKYGTDAFVYCVFTQGNQGTEFDTKVMKETIINVISWPIGGPISGVRTYKRLKQILAEAEINI